MSGRILVTGARGFVGRHVVRHLRQAGHPVREALRDGTGADGADGVAVGEIGPATEWGAALEGVDTVLHLAARVHVMSDSASDPLAEYRRVNVEGTRRLAEQAAAAGARRVVLVSSVKVNGESTVPGAPFRETDPPAPSDPYGISKAEAEAVLRSTRGVETVVVRPPLVYGPGVRANFLRLVQSVERGLPLPLGGIRNRRSLVAVGNLADALAAAATHPAAAGQTFLVSDGPPLSSPELVRGIAAALGRPARLLPVPPLLLRAAGRAVGRHAAVARLCGSLEVDDSHLRRTLGWAPPVTVDQALREVAAWYRDTIR